MPKKLRIHIIIILVFFILPLNFYAEETRTVQPETRPRPKPRLHLDPPPLSGGNVHQPRNYNLPDFSSLFPPLPGMQVRLKGKRKNKILLLSFNSAYSFPHLNLDVGVRLTYFFNTPNQSLKFMVVFSPYFMISKIPEKDGLNFSTLNYLSFSVLGGIFAGGFYFAGGINLHFKISGRDADYWSDDAVYYKKTVFKLMVEIGYIYLPTDSQKFSFAILMFGKFDGIGDYYIGGSKHLGIPKGNSSLFGVSVNFGFNLLYKRKG